MAGNLGSLVVSLGLDAIGFTSGLTKAEYQAKKSLENISRGIQQAAAAIGVGLSATAFVGFIKSTIDAEDHLNDLSKATGIAVEKLGGLGFAAKQSGVDLDSAAKAVGKLNLEIASALGGNEKAQQVFANLGISLKDLKTSTPDEILGKVADAFSESADGAIKAQYGAALFKKEYQAIIPLLDEGGDKLRKNVDYYKQYSQVTAETAAKADQFNDTLVKLNLLSGAFGKTLVAELLGPLQHVADALLEAKENGDQFKEFAKDAASVIKGIGVVAISVVTEISALGHALGAIAAEANRLAHLDFAGAREIEAQATKDQDARFARAKTLIDAINNQTPANATGGTDTKKKTRTLIPLDTSGGAADDAAKKIYEGEIRQLEAYIAREKQLLDARESFLSDSYAEGFLTVKDYYDQVQKARQEALDNTIKAQDAELAAAERLKARASTATDKEDAANKIAAIQERQNAALRAAGFQQEDLDRKQFRDKEQYLNLLGEIDAKLLDIAGDTAKAASIRFDAQNQIFLRSASPETKDRVAQIKAQEQAVIGLNKAQLDYSNTLQQVGIDQAKIDILVQTGALTEIDAINKRADVARQYIAVLNQQVDAYQKVADSLAAGPAKDQALLNVQKLRLEIEQLSVATDVLAKKFNDIFAGAIADGIVELVSGTKSLKDALNDVGKSITTQITQIAAKQVSESLFAKGGPLGGVGNFFAGIFGGGTKDTGAAALVTAGTNLNVAGIDLTASAAALTSAAATLAASSASGSVGSLFGGGGGGFGTGSAFGSEDLGLFLAGGGYPPVGKVSVVGENGPELFIPSSAGKIIPNSELQSRRAQRSSNITINQTFGPGTSGASANQIAVETARRLAIAQRQNR